MTVQGFWIDRHEVTNAQFRRFVTQTGFVTVAERPPRAQDHPDLPREMLVPGSAVFVMPSRSEERSEGRSEPSQRWRFVPGASWQHPTGPASDLAGLENRPVVHVAYQDAMTYAHWLGHELPTEAQWEFAAQGGNTRTEYPWGASLQVQGRWMANTWQGHFPDENSSQDRYKSTAPVGCFAANGYGLYDMIGNVWEITADYYSAPQAHGTMLPTRVIKGSYLCAANFCARYRPAARQPQETDFGASHIGFRTVLNTQGRGS